MAHVLSKTVERPVAAIIRELFYMVIGMGGTEHWPSLGDLGSRHNVMGRFIVDDVRIKLGVGQTPPLDWVPRR